MSEPLFNIAVLLACHNRKQCTLAFLESLISQSVYGKHTIDIYILNDASTDGTAEAVKERFPFVTVIEGTGKMFWAGGMRRIWEYALAQKHYHLFCLCNDDVQLFNDAMERLLKNYGVAGPGSIIVGSTIDTATGNITYGGNVYEVHPFKKTKEFLIEPHEERLLPCRFANANILLVDESTVKQIGILSDKYTHYFADFDYTHTAYRRGIRLLIAPGYYGYCTAHHGIGRLPQHTSLRQRIAYFNSPKGLAFKEQMYFIKNHFPFSYLSMAVKLCMKTLFPVLWDKYKTK